jgi:hypothetical protein
MRLMAHLLRAASEHKRCREQKKEILLTQRRKDAKKFLATQQRFAPLRLCVRNLLDLLAAKDPQLQTPLAV